MSIGPFDRFNQLFLKEEMSLRDTLNTLMEEFPFINPPCDPQNQSPSSKTSSNNKTDISLPANSGFNPKDPFIQLAQIILARGGSLLMALNIYNNRPPIDCSGPSNNTELSPNPITANPHISQLSSVHLLPILGLGGGILFYSLLGQSRNYLSYIPGGTGLKFVLISTAAAATGLAFFINGIGLGETSPAPKIS